MAQTKPDTGDNIFVTDGGTPVATVNEPISEAKNGPGDTGALTFYVNAKKVGPGAVDGVEREDGSNFLCNIRHRNDRFELA